MIATAPATSQVSRLSVSVGFAPHSDSRHAVLDAVEMARAGLGGAACRLALIVTAGLQGVDPVPAVRSVLGPVGIAGGASKGLLLEGGLVTEGALVIALATDGDAACGAAAVKGRSLHDAGQGAARIIMAGWPFRLRYPRGLGIAFGTDGSPLAFLDAWREFMGPKMRTVCSVFSSGPVYGAPGTLASVASVEASYATGLGYADGFAGEGTPLADSLIQGAADATVTALKRLDERSARLVLVHESVARWQALGSAHADEWARIQTAAGDVAPCVGWLCDRVAGYGRGIQPVDDDRALIVAAIGDAPAAVPA
jgi:hypothetical protein